MSAVILDFYGVVFDPRTQKPMLGLMAFLALARQQQIPCAIASSSNTDVITAFLAEHQLVDDIQCIIGGDRVTALKPDPECYLLAAQQMNVPNSECVVIDDTLAPLQQAKALGFQTIHFISGETSFLALAQQLKLN